MYDLIVRNVRMADNSYGLIDVAVKDGNIAYLGKCTLPGKEEWDAEGDLLLPPFVESHIHLDTVLTAGEPRPNQSGTIHEGIQVWGERKKRLTFEDVLERAQRVVDWQIAQGTLFVRSHIDISDRNLTALKAILELKERMATRIHIQVVAFPQDGILTDSDNARLLEEALKLGADAVGAIPHFERSREKGVESLRYCFELAEKYGRMVHVTCDEIDDGESRFLEVVADLAITSGLKERVTASHANAMSLYNEAYTAKLIGLLQQAKMNIVTSPLISSAVQGRWGSYPKNRGLTRVKELWQQGINISIAHDDILTPFYPLGTGNMLTAAHLAAHVCHMTGTREMEETLHMVTDRAARTLGIEDDYGLEVGKPANFITLPARSIVDAIRRQPKCRYVIAQGKLVAKTVPPRTELMIDERIREVDFGRE